MILKIPSLALISIAIMWLFFGISLGILLSNRDNCSDQNENAIFISYPDSRPSFLLEASIEE